MISVEIRTNENHRKLEWASLVSFSGGDEKERALRYGDTILNGFPSDSPLRPHLRVVDFYGNDLGGWQPLATESGTA